MSFVRLGSFDDTPVYEPRRLWYLFPASPSSFIAGIHPDDPEVLDVTRNDRLKVPSKDEKRVVGEPGKVPPMKCTPNVEAVLKSSNSPPGIIEAFGIWIFLVYEVNIFSSSAV